VLSLLTMNVQAAALPRAQALLGWLDGRKDHVVILTETSNGAGTAHLLDRCEAAGWSVAHARSSDGDRGCAIITRFPITVRPDLMDGVTIPSRAVAVTLDTEPALTILGLYVPSSDRAPAKVAKKRAFLTSVLDALERMTTQDRKDLIIGGDYNVITRDHQPRYRAFQPFEYDFLEDLQRLGFTDAHRHRHPDVQAHSWFGHGGNGYQFDYFHTGANVTARVAHCAYLQEPRTARLTDHAAVALALRASLPQQRAQMTSLTTAGALF
jgi:exodeoxyribonuclease-3